MIGLGAASIPLVNVKAIHLSFFERARISGFTRNTMGLKGQAGSKGLGGKNSFGQTPDQAFSGHFEFGRTVLKGKRGVFYPWSSEPQTS